MVNNLSDVQTLTGSAGRLFPPLSRRVAALAGLLAGALFVVGLLAAMDHFAAGLRAGIIAEEVGRLQQAESRGADRLAILFRQYEALHGLARVVGRQVFAMAPGQITVPVAPAVADLFAGELPRFLRVTLIGLNGRTLWSSSPAADGPDLSDRDYFIAVVHGSAQRYIAPPTVGRATGVVSVHFAEPVTGPDGRLAGLSVVTIPPDELTMTERQSREVFPFRASALLRGDGAVLAAENVSLAASIATSPLMAEANAFGDAQGRIAGPDGRFHLVALHVSRRDGLVLAKASDEAWLLETHAEEFTATNNRVLAVGVGLALVVWLGWLLFAMRHRMAVRAVALRVEREAAAGLKLVTDNLRELMVVWDCGADRVPRNLFVSPYCLQLLGIAPEALPADVHAFRSPPQAPGTSAERLELLISGAALPEIEIGLPHADGSNRWFSMRTSAIPPNATQPGRHRFITSCRDITADKAARAALAEVNARISSLALNAPGVLYEVDIVRRPDGQGYAIGTIYAAEGVEALTGLTSAHLSEAGEYEARIGPTAERYRQAAYEHALADGQATVEYRFVRADGSERQLRDSFTLLHETSAGARIVGFVADITEENMLRNALVDASRLSLLGELASSIGHEMTQPLAAIGMHAGLLAAEVPVDSSFGPVVARRTSLIMDLCERGGELIRRIQGFSRRSEEAAVPFDPVHATEDAAAILAPRLRLSPVTLTQIHPETKLRAMGSLGGFQQVIMNLIANAADAYDSHGIHAAADRRITVETTLQGECVVVTVTDAAGGIPATVLPHIFESFFTTKSGTKGTGLGLSISRRIVEAMGGTLVVTNATTGAAFEISLPAAAVE